MEKGKSSKNKDREELKKLMDMTYDKLFKLIMAYPECAQRVIDSIPTLAKYGLKVKSTSTEQNYIPGPVSRQYTMDVILTMAEHDELGDVFIDLEMQNNEKGSEFVRAETYASAVRLEMTMPGTEWQNMPKVVVVMFVESIPGMPNVNYAEGIYTLSGEDAETGEQIVLGDVMPTVIYVNRGMIKDVGYLQSHPEYNLLFDVLYDFQQPDYAKMRCKELAMVMKKIKDNEEILMNMYEPFETFYNNKIDQLRQATDKKISALEAANEVYKSENEVYKSENEVYKSENEALLELVQKMFHGEVPTELERNKVDEMLRKFKIDNR